MQEKASSTATAVGMSRMPIVHEREAGSRSPRYLKMVFATMFALVCLRAVAENVPTFRGDPEHSGIYDAGGAPKLTGAKWIFHARGQLISSPAVDVETVYIGSTGGFLYAVDRAAGSEKWKFNAKARITSSPAVAGGMVFFGAYDGNFYAVDAAAGQLRWKFKTEGERRFAGTHLHGSEPAHETMPDPFDCYLSSPVVWNGAVYFGSGDGNVYALDAATGALKWKFKTGDVVHASPAIWDGTVYIGSWDSFFYALQADTGKEKWRFKTGEDADIHNQVGIQSSAAVMDGVVYFGCRDSHLYALDAKTGEKRWAFFTKGSWVVASPAVRDGKVYFATSDSGLVYALDAKNGDVVFMVNLQGWPSFSSPAIAGEMLYEGSNTGRLNAIDLVNRKLAWSFATDASKQNGPTYTKPDGTPKYEAAFDSDFYDDLLVGYARMMTVGPILSSPVVVENVIYFGGTDGNLYALD